MIMTDEQQQQLKAITLQEGMNAWDFVQSKAEDDQSWIAARHPLLHREGLQFEPPHDQLGGAGSEIR